MALHGYRRLLKSINIAFKDDLYAIQAAKIQLKSEFVKNKTISDLNEIRLLLQGIEEVDEMLKFNIVQGKMNNRGNFEVPLSSEHIVTVEAGQDDPHGPAIEPIDKAIMGKGVKIEKTFSKSKKFQNDKLL